MSRALLVLRAPREACQIDCTARPESTLRRSVGGGFGIRIFSTCRNGSFAQTLRCQITLLRRVIEGQAKPKIVLLGNKTKRREPNLPCHSLVFISCCTAA